VVLEELACIYFKELPAFFYEVFLSDPVDARQNDYKSPCKHLSESLGLAISKPFIHPGALDDYIDPVFTLSKLYSPLVYHNKTICKVLLENKGVDELDYYYQEKSRYKDLDVVHKELNKPICSECYARNNYRVLYNYCKDNIKYIKKEKKILIYP